MFEQFTIIFDRQWQTYTFLMILGIGSTIAWLVYRVPKEDRAKTLDVCLAALIGGVVLGRLLHVALNWAFFVDRIDLITQIHKEGGLEWQGVMIGAGLSGILMAKLRRLDISTIIEATVIILPLIAFLGWYGCATAGCAYGQVVERMADYPAWLTWDSKDIYGLMMPRFATQPIGMAYTAIILMIGITLYWRGWFLRSRLWMILLLLSIGSFMIAFLRDDYALEWMGLRSGQWLDLGIGLLAFLLMFWSIRPRMRN